MRVLVQSRVNLFKYPGGDTVQLSKSVEYLRCSGCVQVDVSLELQPNLRNYDLIHIFDLDRHETYIQTLNAKRQGKPVILSPIYWNFSEFERHGQVGLRRLANKLLPMGGIQYVRGVWRFLIDGERNKATLAVLLNGYRRLQRRVLGMVDLLLPNAEVEMQLIKRDYGLNHVRYLVVPNGVDRKFGAAACQKSWQERELVLCVARIETRKNQLALVRALRGTGLPLVIVGQHAPNHRRYYDMVRAEADENVTFLGRVDHEKLPSLYAEARVHVLPSWLETPGLSSLEAAAAGCNIVVTDRGSTREYFDEYAYYCEPDSVESIRQAILSAYEAPPNPALREHILEHYTWEKTAEKTLEGYRWVLAR